MLLHDFRYAARSLRKSPGFAAAAILALALGIGANTAIFSVLEGVVLAPLPYRQPDRLVLALLYNRTLRYATDLSYPDFLDWRRAAGSFEGLAVYAQQGLDLTHPGTPQHLEGMSISAGGFNVLGLRMALGREFSPEEDQPGGPPAAIVSDRLWRERWAASPRVLGKTVTLSGVDYTVVGVLPRGFRLGNEEADVFTAVGRGNPLQRDDRTIHNLVCIARLKPGVSIDQARTEMETVQQNIDRLYPATERGQGIFLQPWKESMVGDVRGTILLLLGAVALVLLIACANVANLLLARAVVRARELAVRLALGAGRMQIVRQLLAEAILLSLTGAALGLLFAKWGLRLILAAVPRSLPRADNIHLNGPVLLFALVVSLAAAILFGLLPAWRASNCDLQLSLKEGGRGSAGGHHRTRQALMIVQMALAMVLLTGAGLLFRTIRNLLAVNPGFETRGVVTFRVGLSPAAAKTAAGIRNADQQLVQRIRQIPGIQAADFTALVPLGESSNSGPFWVGAQRPVSMAEAPRANYYWTGPDYLRTMGIPLLAGRFLSPHDTMQSPPVAVINSSLAATYFKGKDPVGQMITIPHWSDARIVGVVGHVDHWRLDRSFDQYPQNQIYASFYQLLEEWVPAFQTDITMVVRTGMPTAALIPAVRAAVYGSGNDQPVYDIHAMPDLVAGSMAAQRLPMVLLGALALLALLLAWIGIYGVMAYATTERVREIGIRMALGALRRDILGMVLGQGLRIALAGIAGGILASLVLVRLLSSFSHLLYGVGASDPWTLIFVSAVLLSAALIACYFPAKRAAQADPMSALRQD